jgi:hypothetical protein
MIPTERYKGRVAIIWYGSSLVTGITAISWSDYDPVRESPSNRPLKRDSLLESNSCHVGFQEIGYPEPTAPHTRQDLGNAYHLDGESIHRKPGPNSTREAW